MKLGLAVVALAWGAVMAAPGTAGAQEMSAEEIAAMNAAVAPDDNHALLEARYVEFLEGAVASVKATSVTQSVVHMPPESARKISR